MTRGHIHKEGMAFFKLAASAMDIKYNAANAHAAELKKLQKEKASLRKHVELLQFEGENYITCNITRLHIRPFSYSYIRDALLHALDVTQGSPHSFLWEASVRPLVGTRGTALRWLQLASVM